MDSFIYALVLAPALTELLPRSGIAPEPKTIGLYGSILFAVFLAGWGVSFIWRPVADRFGRKNTLAGRICFLHVDRPVGRGGGEFHPGGGGAAYVHHRRAGCVYGHGLRRRSAGHSIQPRDPWRETAGITGPGRNGQVRTARRLMASTRAGNFPGNAAASAPGGAERRCASGWGWRNRIRTLPP